MSRADLIEKMAQAAHRYAANESWSYEEAKKQSSYYQDMAEAALDALRENLDYDAAATELMAVLAEDLSPSLTIYGFGMKSIVLAALGEDTE